MPTLRFRSFGPPAVEGPGGPVRGTAAQRQALALLAVLAAAGDAGVSRDKLLVLFWPESEPRRASHCLNQLVHALRRSLGSANALAGTTELRLDPVLLPSDRHEFAEAWRRGELETAVALYRGPFLDGFYLADAPEFERWMEEERAALARWYGEALETLAVRAEARGDLRRAADWWMRLARHDPLSSRVAIHVMRALAAAGDRGTAIQHASAYESLLRAELDATPNPAVGALAAQLRRAPGSAGSVAVLPFVPLDDATGGEEFAAGLAEELRSEIAARNDVRVASRTSVAALRDVADVREIGRRLGVASVLEGSVRADGTRVRVTARLLSTLDGCEIWSGKFDGRSDGGFEAQEALARAIAAALRLGGHCEERSDEAIGWREATRLLRRSAPRNDVGA